MRIEKMTTFDMIQEIKNYAETFQKKDVTEKVYYSISSIYSSLKNNMNFDGLYVECSDTEIDDLVSDYITYLSGNKSLFLVFLIGKCVSVESIGKIKSFKDIAECVWLLPNSHIDFNKISVFVADYSVEYSEIYDIDFALHILN